METALCAGKNHLELHLNLLIMVNILFNIILNNDFFLIEKF